MGFAMLRKGEEAQAFLRRVLADGPKRMTTVLAEAEAAGIAKGTVLKFKASVGVISHKQLGGWEWQLGGAPPEAAAAPSPGEDSPLRLPEAPTPPVGAATGTPVAAPDRDLAEASQLAQASAAALAELRTDMEALRRAYDELHERLHVLEARPVVEPEPGPVGQDRGVL